MLKLKEDLLELICTHLNNKLFYLKIMALTCKKIKFIIYEKTDYSLYKNQYFIIIKCEKIFKMIYNFILNEVNLLTKKYKKCDLLSEDGEVIKLYILVSNNKNIKLKDEINKQISNIDISYLYFLIIKIIDLYEDSLISRNLKKKLLYKRIALYIYNICIHIKLESHDPKSLITPYSLSRDEHINIINRKFENISPNSYRILEWILF
jgi:hypothetical protein